MQHIGGSYHHYIICVSHNFSMAAMRASTASVRVAQLVQKRTAVRCESMRVHGENTNCLPRISICSEVRIGNC